MINNTNDHNIEKKHIDMFCEFIYMNFGIYTEESKKDILAYKISSLMAKEGIVDTLEYYHYIASPCITQKQKNAQNVFVDTITVHKTHFFREKSHFEFIKKNINEIVSNSKSVKASNELRVWSSASSSGEEAYSLAMLLNEILPSGIKPKILATDVSPGCIARALNGSYKFSTSDNLNDHYIDKYFIQKDDRYSICNEIKNLVTFRLFNLMENFPFKLPFDIIFCRNVMIYFSENMQQRLIDKFYNVVVDQGLLFVGHSESLIKLKHDFAYHEPTIYKRK